VLDVFISTDFIIRDCNRQRNDGFVWKRDCRVNEDVSIPADSKLRKVASSAPKQNFGEAFVANQHCVDFLSDRFDACTLENEGGSDGRIAYDLGVPAIVIRTFSDKTDDRMHESYASFAQYAAENSARVVLIMLKNIATGDRRQETGDRRQETGDRRQVGTLIENSRNTKNQHRKEKSFLAPKAPL